MASRRRRAHRARGFGGGGDADDDENESFDGRVVAVAAVTAMREELGKCAFDFSLLRAALSTADKWHALNLNNITNG